MDKVQIALQIVGAFGTVFTCLHMLFPKVQMFQKLGDLLHKVIGVAQ